MAITRSWGTAVALTAEAVREPVPIERWRELWWMLSSSLFVALALFLVFCAKTQDFAEINGRLKNGSVLNLNAVTTPDELSPFLLVIPDADRGSAAENIVK